MQYIWLWEWCMKMLLIKQDYAQGMIKLMSPLAAWHCIAQNCMALFGMLHWTIWQIIQPTLLCLCRSVKWQRRVVFDTFAAVFAVPKKFPSLFLYLSCHFWRQDKLQRSGAKFVWIFGWWVYDEVSAWFAFMLKLNNLQIPNCPRFRQMSTNFSIICCWQRLAGKSGEMLRERAFWSLLI